MPQELSSLKYSSSRISGLASGLDTESMIESLMKAERQKVVKIEQELMYANWQQEAYRDVIQSLSDFTKSQFNPSDNSKNILSTANLKMVTMASSEYASVITNGDADVGAYKINEIVQTAKASEITSNTSVKSGIQANKDLSLISVIEVEGMSFYARLDGEQYEIKFGQNYTDGSSFVQDMQTQFDDIFGQERINVSLGADNNIQFAATNSTLQIIDDVESDIKLDYLGLTTGDMSILNLRGSIKENFGSVQDISFKINGVDFDFSHNDSIEKIMRTVNESAAQVKMTYNSISDKMTITSSRTGSNSYINIENLTGDFFGEQGIIKISEGLVKNGQDAMFYLNDENKDNLITRSSNTFSIDNVTYTLKKQSSQAIDFNIENNVDGIYKSITSFIEEYNSIVEELTSSIMQKRDYDYKPLTDEQKKDMTEKQILDWEEKGKQGILKADSLFFNMLNELRSAFTFGVENLNMTFGSIGINTSNYTNNGKITIDETVLRGALEGRFEEVVDLFTRESTVQYARDQTYEDSSRRFNGSGFTQRVNDIIKKYITSSRDKNGNKGMLLEKAGIKNDASEGANAISRRMDEIKKRLDAANKEMAKKEKAYWSQFTNLELAIHRMNTQSGYVSSMMEK